jgi:4-hydroxythreonine-4-phosphate dehydrogenase
MSDHDNPADDPAADPVDDFADELADEDTALYEFPMPLLITSGDPAGIGPEVTHKAVRRLVEDGRLLAERPVTVIGDAFLYARHLSDPSEMHAYNIIPVEDFIMDPGYLMEKFTPEPGTPWRPLFLDCGFKSEAELPVGKPSVLSGERALTYLDAAIELLADEYSETIVTAPICKDAMDDELFPFPGHTEYFAEACEVRHPVMLLVGGGLRVALATIHEPLSRVPKLLSRARVRGTIRTLHTALQQDFGISKPRVAVCGLNPHAGESGRFGKEDEQVIRPEVERLRATGLDVAGPLAADSVFAHAREGRYDGVVAMYHDQGLIPVKTLAFHEGVNVTLGLPIVRTSPDHGTAFDIAGQGKADGGAMYAAVMLAEEISKRRDE